MVKNESTPGSRRETLTEAFASWALEGMYPDEQDLRYARAYIDGEMTLDEIIKDVKKQHRPQ